MINISKAVFENGLEAKKKLQEMGGSVTFCEDEDYPNYTEPYVLIDEGDGEISDNMVLSAKIDEVSGLFMCELANGKGWHTISDFLGYTENNVYEQILKD